MRRKRKVEINYASSVNITKKRYNNTRVKIMTSPCSAPAIAPANTRDAWMGPCYQSNLHP